MQTYEQLLVKYNEKIAEKICLASGYFRESGEEIHERQDRRSLPKGYPEDKSQYADPVNMRYPLDTCEHVDAALSYWGMPKNRKFYTSSEQSIIENRICRRAKECGIDAKICKK